MPVQLINDSHALLSMRDSDFDSYSAYGEVIDNSIQAEAKNIKIKFNTTIKKRRRKALTQIDSVIFGDDGGGMNEKVLHRCLQLGFSDRYNDRKGIGRFGVGMTLGAIHECKKIEVYSKEKKGKWLYTYIDIDMIISSPCTMEEIPKPVEKIPSEELSKLCGESSGTIVIWSKYDKQRDNGDKILEECKLWFGRTYRKFIWEGVNIELDGKKIFAIDPLFLRTDKTQFPDDPKAEDKGETELEILIPEEQRIDPLIESSIVKIKFSLLPEHFRRHGSGNSGNHPENKVRYVNRNTGISILRNNREVRDPDFPIPRLLAGKFANEINRFWGCEISFNPELDYYFSVKNIKRGAEPRAGTEFREELKKTLTPILSSRLIDIREHWREIEELKEQEHQLQNGDIGGIGKHTKSAKITEDTSTTKSKIKEPKNKEEIVNNDLTNAFPEVPANQRKKLEELILDKKITIMEKHWDSPNFVQVKHYGGGNSTLTYNISHKFFEKYSSLLSNIKELETEEEANIQKDVLTLIDLLLVSFSLSEKEYEQESEWTVEEFLEDFKLKWGANLKRLFNNWENE